MSNYTTNCIHHQVCWGAFNCQTKCQYFEERPQGDLISRKFVNEVVCAEFVDLQDGTEEWRSYVNDTCESILKKIDNAPAVELVNDSQRLVKELVKGEWIIVDDTEKFIAKCSICGRIEDSRMVKDYPFCHCGAKMKGGKE